MAAPEKPAEAPKPAKKPSEKSHGQQDPDAHTPKPHGPQG